MDVGEVERLLLEFAHKMYAATAVEVREVVVHPAVFDALRTKQWVAYPALIKEERDPDWDALRLGGILLVRRARQ